MKPFLKSVLLACIVLPFAFGELAMGQRAGQRTNGRYEWVDGEQVWTSEGWRDGEYAMVEWRWRDGKWVEWIAAAPPGQNQRMPRTSLTPPPAGPPPAMQSGRNDRTPPLPPVQPPSQRPSEPPSPQSWSPQSPQSWQPQGQQTKTPFERFQENAIARMQTVSGSFSSSSEGSRIITVLSLSDGRASTVQIWDVSTGQELHKLEMGFHVSSACLSSDGTKVATVHHNYSSRDGSYRDTTMRVWNIGSRKVLYEIKYNKRLDDPRFSPDGTKIAAQSSDFASNIYTILVWNERGKLLGEIKSSKLVTRFRFSTDGQSITTEGATFSDRRTWDVETGREIQKLTPPPAGPRSQPRS